MGCLSADLLGSMRANQGQLLVVVIIKVGTNVRACNLLDRDGQLDLLCVHPYRPWNRPGMSLPSIAMRMVQSAIPQREKRTQSIFVRNVSWCTIFWSEETISVQCVSAANYLLQGKTSVSSSYATTSIRSIWLSRNKSAPVVFQIWRTHGRRCFFGSGV